MLIAAGVDPVKDLSKVIIAGSHSASLAALSEGKVDAAAASYNSFGKAVDGGAIDPAKFKPLAKSQPIPNPPLAMNKGLSDELKKQMNDAMSECKKQFLATQVAG